MAEGTLKVSLDISNLWERRYLISTADQSLDLSKAGKQLGFSITTSNPGTYSRQEVYYMANGIDLSVELAQSPSAELLWLYPLEVTPFITKVSWFGYIPDEPKRDLGRYDYLNASWAFLDKDPAKPGFLKLKVFASTFKDAEAIYRQIRLGDLKPSAENNWSQKQESGRPR